jgi:SAM-dependent methyltransferase
MKIYDEIAKEFSATRITPWPLVKSFVNSLKQHTTLLDVGCGNGKNQFRDDLYYVSVDSSIEMCKFVKGAINCCATRLPFHSNSIDNCISIACIHHLDSFEKRKLAVSEIYRVLKPGGSAMISFWGAQKKYGIYDTYIKWKTDDKLRYYYLSTIDCIKHLFKDFEYSVVEDYNNFYVQLKKNVNIL